MVKSMAILPPEGPLARGRPMATPGGDRWRLPQGGRSSAAPCAARPAPRRPACRADCAARAWAIRAPLLSGRLMYKTTRGRAARGPTTTASLRPHYSTKSTPRTCSEHREASGGGFAAPYGGPTGAASNEGDANYAGDRSVYVPATTASPRGQCYGNFVRRTWSEHREGCKGDAAAPYGSPEGAAPNHEKCHILVPKILITAVPG